MLSLFSILCLLLWLYQIFTLGDMLPGKAKNIVTLSLCLPALGLGLLLSMPWAGWLAVTAILLVFTFFYDKDPFPLRWYQTLLPGLLLAAAAPFSYHWMVLLLCFCLHVQLSRAREAFSWVSTALTAVLYLCLPNPWLILGLFVVLEYDLRRYSTGFARKTADFQTTVLAHQYEEIKTIYLNMRGWRHDYHNHLQVMKADLAMNQLDQLGEYLNKLEQDLSQVDSYVRSGNLMVDAILNSKLSLAAQNRIDLHCTANLPETLPIREVDLCVILGNLLDNAIEACEKIPEAQRFLRVYTAVVKNQFYLSVQNAAKEELDFDEQNYISKKRGNHGLGMKRVKVLVDQYQGFLNLQNQPGIFAAEVSIPLK